MPGANDPLDRSILIDVRPMNNVDENDNGFDNKLIPLINTYIMMAHQFGIGYDGFRMTGSQQTWRNWLGDNGDKLEAIKTWLGYSVLLMFNPPDNATHLSSIERQIAKKEWMLNSKSQLDGVVKDYVPSAVPYYEHMAEVTIDED